MGNLVSAITGEGNSVSESMPGGVDCPSQVKASLLCMGFFLLDSVIFS